MVGRDVKLEYDKTPQEFGEKILKVEKLNYTDKFGTKKLDDLSFSLKAGEVLGIAGIEGNGQKEAMEILTGNRLSLIHIVRQLPYLERSYTQILKLNIEK